MASKTVGIKTEVLNDLASRFLINIPDEDKDDPVKLCSHVELAYWFYLDLQRPEDPSLPACSMKEFMATIFRHCPFLVRESVAKDLDTLITQWKTHKYSRPVRGAIILNQNLTKCLLVQGYPASTSWGFPKGKLEQGENDRDSAVREVYEETGYDIRDLIREDWSLEAQLNENTAKMYVIPSVPDNTDFAPRTRKEIRAIQWFRIEDLPRHKKDLTSKQALGKNANSFFMIIPFMNPLRRWIAGYQQKMSKSAQKTKNSRGVSVSATFQPPENSFPQRSATSPIVIRTSAKSSAGPPSPITQPHQHASIQSAGGTNRNTVAQSGPGSIPPQPRVHPDPHAGMGVELLLPKMGSMDIGGGDGMGAAHPGSQQQPVRHHSSPLLGTPISYHHLNTSTAPHVPYPHRGPLLPTPVLHSGSLVSRSSTAPLLATPLHPTGNGVPTSRVTLLPTPHPHTLVPAPLQPVPIDYYNQRAVYPPHLSPATMTTVTRVTATSQNFNPTRAQTSSFNSFYTIQQTNQQPTMIETSIGQQQRTHYPPGIHLQPSLNFQKFMFNKDLILASQVSVK